MNVFISEKYKKNKQNQSPNMKQCSAELPSLANRWYQVFESIITGLVLLFVLCYFYVSHTRSPYASTKQLLLATRHGQRQAPHPHSRHIASHTHKTPTPAIATGNNTHPASSYHALPLDQHPPVTTTTSTGTYTPVGRIARSEPPAALGTGKPTGTTSGTELSSHRRRLSQVVTALPLVETTIFDDDDDDDDLHTGGVDSVMEVDDDDLSSSGDGYTSSSSSVSFTGDDYNAQQNRRFSITQHTGGMTGGPGGGAASAAGAGAAPLMSDRLMATSSMSRHTTHSTATGGGILSRIGRTFGWGGKRMDDASKPLLDSAHTVPPVTIALSPPVSPLVTVDDEDVVASHALDDEEDDDVLSVASPTLAKPVSRSRDKALDLLHKMKHRSSSAATPTDDEEAKKELDVDEEEDEEEEAEDNEVEEDEISMFREDGLEPSETTRVTPLIVDVDDDDDDGEEEEEEECKDEMDGMDAIAPTSPVLPEEEQHDIAPSPPSRPIGRFAYFKMLLGFGGSNPGGHDDDAAADYYHYTPHRDHGRWVSELSVTTTTPTYTSVVGRGLTINTDGLRLGGGGGGGGTATSRSITASASSLATPRTRYAMFIQPHGHSHKPTRRLGRKRKHHHDHTPDDDRIHSSSSSSLI